MNAPSRIRRQYDHRFRQLVHETGDIRLAIDRGVPRSTARDWLRSRPATVVSIDFADLAESELRQELAALRRRYDRLVAIPPSCSGTREGLRVQARPPPRCRRHEEDAAATGDREFQETSSPPADSPCSGTVCEALPFVEAGSAVRARRCDVVPAVVSTPADDGGSKGGEGDGHVG